MGYERIEAMRYVMVGAGVVLVGAGLILVVVGLALVGWSGFLVGQQMSSDAIAMAVGILFGVMAGIPMALMVLVSGRDARRETHYHMHMGADVSAGSTLLTKQIDTSLQVDTDRWIPDKNSRG